MAKKADDRATEQVNKAIAEQVFGWKSVRKYQGEMFGRKQDKAGHWRRAKVPNYAGDPRLAYEIDDRMKALKMGIATAKSLQKSLRPRSCRQSGRVQSSDARLR